jgi:predicted permease
LLPLQRVCGKWDAKAKNGEMENIAAQMVILFLLVIVGFVANRLGYTNAESDKKLSGLIFDFTCPALVLSSVMGESLPDSRLVLPLLGVSLATYLLLTPIAIFLPRLITHKQGDQGIYGFMMAFGNVGFIGYPIVSALVRSAGSVLCQCPQFSQHLFRVCVGFGLSVGWSAHPFQSPHSV